MRLQNCNTCPCILVVGSILLRGTHPLLTRMKLLNEGEKKVYVCGKLGTGLLVLCLIAVERCYDVCSRLCVLLSGSLGIEGTRPHVQLPGVVKVAMELHPPVLQLLQSLQYAAIGGRGRNFGTCTDINYDSYLLGISIGDAIVFFSSSSMSPSFHCSRKICHVPRKKVVTGMMRSQSFRLSLGSV